MIEDNSVMRREREGGEELTPVNLPCCRPEKDKVSTINKTKSLLGKIIRTISVSQDDYWQP